MLLDEGKNYNNGDQCDDASGGELAVVGAVFALEDVQRQGQGVLGFIGDERGGVDVNVPRIDECVCTGGNDAA